MDQVMLYSILDTDRNKFICAWSRKTGTITLTSSPIHSNYFTSRIAASNWLAATDLDTKRYGVREFEKVEK